MLFNEPKLLKLTAGIVTPADVASFSALQRAEIAEMREQRRRDDACDEVSVLFNEPKLLKSDNPYALEPNPARFSALQRAEIAEIARLFADEMRAAMFQCSSTSRNC